MDTTIHDNGITQFIMCTPPFCRGGGGGVQNFKKRGGLDLIAIFTGACWEGRDDLRIQLLL